MKNILGILTIVIFTLASTLSVHASPFGTGKYESLDGKYKHEFKASGDYSGAAKLSKTYSGTGLYEKASEICWVPKKDGTKGATGNVILYVGEAQCCLEFRQISNKFAVSKIWVKGTGTGYVLCQNQVLQKIK
ncbi:MAG: hypothetical protein Q2484_17025 [Candidatus Sedimenticola sp. (ex Thyasira tokunagai)]